MVYGNATHHACGHSDDEEEEAGAVIYIAVVMCALGSISQNLGNNVMSLGHRKKKEVLVRNESKRLMSMSSMDEKSEESLAPMMEDGKREAFVLLAGRAVFVVGALLIFGSFLTGAPIAMLAPMEAIQFVSNMVFAKYIIGEDPTKIMYFGAVGIVFGLMLIVFGSPHVSCLHPIRNMVSFYSPPEGTAYLVYLVFAGIGLVFSHATYVKMQAAREAKAPWAGVPALVEPLCYATSSTLVGTQSVLFVKCIGAILLSMQEEDGDTPGYTFSHWFTYTCVVCWLITVAVWITRLDASLQKYNPLFIIPVMQMGFIFFASISGGIYFHEFENFDAEPYYWPCYIIGNVLMFGGIAMLTPHDVFNTPKDVAVDGMASEESTQSTKPKRGNKIQPIEEPSSPQAPVEPTRTDET